MALSCSRETMRIMKEAKKEAKGAVAVARAEELVATTASIRDSSPVSWGTVLPTEVYFLFLLSYL